MSGKFEKQHKRRINSLIGLLADLTVQLRSQELWNKLSPDVRKRIEDHIKDWDSYQYRIRNRRYKAHLTQIEQRLAVGKKIKGEKKKKKKRA